MDDILRIVQRSEQRGLTILRPAAASATMADEFVATLQTSENSVLTLIGHNANGQFRFADGSAVDLATLGSLSGSSVVAVISCESARYLNGNAAGLPTVLTYRLAELTEAKFVERVNQIASDQTVSVQLAREMLEAALDDAARELEVRGFFKFGLVTSGGVVGVGIYQQLD